MQAGWSFRRDVVSAGNDSRRIHLCHKFKNYQLIRMKMLNLNF